MPDERCLVLASASSARKAMLESAGLLFEVIPADIDEPAITRSISEKSAGVAPAEIAAALAAEKARTVSRLRKGAFVIGSDQVLAIDRRLLDKAQSNPEARQHLQLLRARTHTLVSAAALARDGHVSWQTSKTAEMTMRNFSDAFLDDYLARAGKPLLSSVGCYELEGLGVQLFERIDGDYFTILGLPLLELLSHLREI